MKQPNGLLAVGGDLSPERLIHAYSHGIFPWYNDDQPILWWSPEPRMVFYPGKVKASKSLKKHLRRTPLKVTIDQSFREVITACSAPRSEGGGTWITDEMLEAYCHLHQLGIAHSIETRNENNEIIGGLYGIAIGAVFFGESMFSRATNASKVAIFTFSEWLARHDFAMIDCQVENPHLVSLGGEIIDRNTFERTLHQHAATRAADFQTFWSEHRNSVIYDNIGSQQPENSATA